MAQNAELERVIAAAVRDQTAGLRESINALTKRLKVHKAETAKRIKTLETRIAQLEKYQLGLEMLRVMKQTPDQRAAEEELRALEAARPKKTWHKGRLVDTPPPRVPAEPAQKVDVVDHRVPKRVRGRAVR